MEKRGHIRLWIGFAGLFAALILLVIWNINAGSVHLPVSEIIEILFSRTGDNAAIVWNIRLPRIISALMLGGALALSGFLLQTFFANPIAGPFILGISSGAKLILSLTLIGFLSRGVAVSSFALIVAAFLGATLSMGFVLAISLKAKQMSLLIIGGVMIGYICSAITDFVVTFADDANIINLHHWSQGSFSGMSWSNVGVMVIVVIPVLICTFMLSKPISAYQLGEVYAQNMGVNIRVFRIALIILSSLLSACVTAFAGPISFVGVAVPHLIRSIFKTAKPIIMIPACFLGGAVFCLFCDLIARTAVSPAELSISSVTAVFGAPVVIMVMLRRQKDHI
ncbi:MAG: iron ABC transporter permease [Oscillospiraceae bacterium]|nr:iron ABC transporter permease [Oscillospiraceae bacterium]